MAPEELQKKKAKPEPAKKSPAKKPAPAKKAPAKPAPAKGKGAGAVRTCFLFQLLFKFTRYISKLPQFAKAVNGKNALLTVA